jgi:hypothetical protein
MQRETYTALREAVCFHGQLARCTSIHAQLSVGRNLATQLVRNLTYPPT